MGSVDRRSTSPWTRRGLIAAVAGSWVLVSGCDFLGLGSEEERAREGIVTIAAAGDLAPLVDALPVASMDDADAEVIAALEGGIDVQEPACITVESVGSSIVTTFDGCVLNESGYPLDGTMYVRNIVGDGQSASYSVTLDQLRLGYAASIDGTWSVSRQPGGVSSWSGSLDVETADQRSLGRELDVSWTGSNGCRTIDLGAELGFFGVTNLAVFGLEVCGHRCPTAGEAEISWDAGSSAAWRYDGSDQTEVVIARGERFMVDLGCEPN